MPHDKKGRALSVGSTILILATVTELSPSEDHCNVTAEIQGGDGEYKPTFVGNSKLVELVEAEGDSKPRAKLRCESATPSDFGFGAKVTFSGTFSRKGTSLKPEKFEVGKDYDFELIETQPGSIS